MSRTAVMVREEDFKAQRDKFATKKRDLESRINSLRKTISSSKKKAEKLMREIDRSRPIIDGCQAICHECDIVSLKYQRTEVDPENPGAYWFALQHYTCIICGREEVRRDSSSQPRPYAPPFSYELNI